MTELEQVPVEWVGNRRDGIPLGRRHEVLRVVKEAGGVIDHDTLVEAIGTKWSEVTVAECEQWIRDLHGSAELEQPTSGRWRVAERGRGRLEVNRLLDAVSNHVMQLHSNVDTVAEYTACLPHGFGPSAEFSRFVHQVFHRSEALRIRALVDDDRNSAETVPKLLKAIDRNGALFCRAFFVMGDEYDAPDYGLRSASHRQFDELCCSNDRDNLDVEKLRAHILPKPPPESVQLVRKWVNKNVAHHEPKSSPRLTVQHFRDCRRHLESCLKHLNLVIRNVGLTSATPTKQFDILEFARGVTPELSQSDREYWWRHNELAVAQYRRDRATKNSDGTPAAVRAIAEAEQELSNAQAWLADLNLD